MVPNSNAKKFWLLLLWMGKGQWEKTEGHLLNLIFNFIPEFLLIINNNHLLSTQHVLYASSERYFKVFEH